MDRELDKDQALRDHLLELLRSRSAHLDFGKAIGGLPPELRGAQAAGIPHTVWQLLEHLRIAQWDILEFSRNPDHVSPAWPEGYWPETAAPPDAAAWDRSVEAFRRDLQAMQDLVAAPKTDLYAKIPWGDGQTVLREAILVADHNAYHLGQIVSVRQALGAWG
jgi:DinB family protein